MEEQVQQTPDAETVDLQNAGPATGEPWLHSLLRGLDREIFKMLRRPLLV